MDAVSQFRYRPAGASGWLAVAWGSQLLVVHPQAVDTGIAVFAGSQGADSAPGFQVALDELTKGGLSATPPFALLEWSGGGSERAVRVIVRGGVQAVVTAGGSTYTMDGTGVSTWTEQNFQQVADIEVVVVPEPAEAADARWLPIERGTALVSRISSVPGGAVTADAPAASTSTPVPAPAPSSGAGSHPVTDSVSETTMADLPAELAGVPAELHSDVRPADAGYDYLFGETMYRNVSDAAVREPDLDVEQAPAAEVSAGDHDGMTIMTGELKKLRGSRKARTAVDAPAVAPPPPALFLELSTGSREPLSQPVLVGRAPTASKVSGGALPRLVTIPGDKDISRNHAQFAVEGGTVVVTDLHSRNGTQVVMPGKAPQQLRQGEPTAVIVGTVVDLGGGVTLTVCEEG
ncbi:FHA domain-containing protein [Homoserinimonas sp. A447]